MADDFKQMMLTTGFNVFILQEEPDGVFTQRVIRWLKNMEINATMA